MRTTKFSSKYQSTAKVSAIKFIDTAGTWEATTAAVVAVATRSRHINTIASVGSAIVQPYRVSACRIDLRRIPTIAIALASIRLLLASKGAGLDPVIDGFEMVRGGERDVDLSTNLQTCQCV